MKNKPLPLIPELDDPDMMDGTNFFVRDLLYSWDVLVENLWSESQHHQS